MDTSINDKNNKFIDLNHQLKNLDNQRVEILAELANSRTDLHEYIKTFLSDMTWLKRSIFNLHSGSFCSTMYWFHQGKEPHYTTTARNGYELITDIPEEISFVSELFTISINFGNDTDTLPKNYVIIGINGHLSERKLTISSFNLKMLTSFITHYKVKVNIPGVFKKYLVNVYEHIEDLTNFERAAWFNSLSRDDAVENKENV